MKDRIFETFSFGIVCLSGDNQILRKNKKANELLHVSNSKDLLELINTFKKDQLTSWTDSNNNILYIQHFEVESSSDSLVLLGTDPDFTSNLPTIFEKSIEDLPADPHGVVDRITFIISDALTFERFDLLRIDPHLRKYTYEYSIGINIEGTVHTAYSEIRNSGLNWIVKNEVSHLVEDLGKVDTGFMEDPLLFQAGFKSILRIPILFDHGVVGAILLASSEVGRFKLEDAFFLNQLARLVAQAYFHSGLQLELEYKQLTAATFVQTVISLLNENNVKDFLGEYCEKLRITSSMEHVSVFLLDSKNKLRLCLAEAGSESLDSSEWIPIPDTGMNEMLQKALYPFLFLL
jgi:hypothetical protein